MIEREGERGGERQKETDRERERERDGVCLCVSERARERERERGRGWMRGGARSDRVRRVTQTPLSSTQNAPFLITRRPFPRHETPLL